MIYRIAFYQSFGKKLRDGVCFHADWERKGHRLVRRGGSFAAQRLSET